MGNFSRQPSSPVVKTLRIVVLGLVLPIFAVIVMLTMRGWNADNSAGGGQDVPGGGIYTRYQGRIYMNIPFQGYYLVQGADPGSFGMLGQFDSGNLGKDNNAVYCGSQVIAQLRPEQVRFVRNGYVSDGARVWYCSGEKDNPDFHWWQYFTRGGGEDDAGKPRDKDYALAQLAPVDATNLKIVIGAYAQDGKRAFYEGAVIAGADGATLEKIALCCGDRAGRDDAHYARDHDRVYYQGVALPGAKPASFRAFEPDDDQWQTLYGQDAATGQYYLGAQPFPAQVDGMDSSNLHLLIADRARANHEIFYNASGLWYWDYQDDALKRGCAYPFHVAGAPGAGPALIVPGVWADDRDAFLLQVGEDWGNSNADKSLRSRRTQLWMLPGLARAQWSKVADMPGNGQGGTRGTLLKAGTQLYFAPVAGQGHGFNATLYLVLDLNGLERDILSSDYYRKVFQSGDIQALDSSDSTIICRMVSRYPPMWEFWK